MKRSSEPQSSVVVDHLCGGMGAILLGAFIPHVAFRRGHRLVLCGFFPFRVVCHVCIWKARPPPLVNYEARTCISGPLEQERSRLWDQAPKCSLHFSVALFVAIFFPVLPSFASLMRNLITERLLAAATGSVDGMSGLGRS